MPIHEEHRKRRGKNIALALSLAAFVVLLFFVTLARMKAGAGS